MGNPSPPVLVWVKRSAYRCPEDDARLIVADVEPGWPGWWCRTCGQDRSVDVLKQLPRRKPMPLRDERDPQARPRFTSDAPADGAAADDADARLLAMMRDRLDGILAQLAAVGGLKERAARLHQALAALDAPNLPPLPASITATTDAPKKPRNYGHCVGCGRVFTGPLQWRTDEFDARWCRATCRPDAGNP